MLISPNLFCLNTGTLFQGPCSLRLIWMDNIHLTDKLQAPEYLSFHSKHEQKVRLTIQASNLHTGEERWPIEQKHWTCCASAY